MNKTKNFKQNSFLMQYRCHGAALFNGNGVWTTHDNIDVDWTGQMFGHTCSCSIDSKY